MSMIPTADLSVSAEAPRPKLPATPPRVSQGRIDTTARFGKMIPDKIDPSRAQNAAPETQTAASKTAPTAETPKSAGAKSGAAIGAATAPDTRSARSTAEAPQFGPPAPAAKTAEAAPAPHGLTFHEVLSSLNPLQYIPVVGTVYRSVTGDTIPDSTREAGSLAFSGLTSGPIGIATNLATSLLERLTGIDPEKIGANLLARIGIGSGAKPDPVPAAAKTPDAARTEAVAEAPPAAKPQPIATAEITPAKPVPNAATMPGINAAAPPKAPAMRGLTVAQLAAYGVKQTADGNLRRGDVQGADVLNSIELNRLGVGGATVAANAYAAKRGAG